MAITHMFKGSKGFDSYGYYGYIENGQLVLGESWPREGGETYRGSFEGIPESYVRELEQKAPTLIAHIRKYMEEHPNVSYETEVRHIAAGQMFKHKGRIYTVINGSGSSYASSYIIDADGKEVYLVAALDMESHRVQLFANNLHVIRYYKNKEIV